MHTFHPSSSAANIQSRDSKFSITGFRFFKTALVLMQVVLLPVLAARAQEHQPLPDPGSAKTVNAPHAIAKEFGKLPLSFEANQGQSDPRVRFLSRGNGYSLFLTDREAVLALQKPEHGKNAAKDLPNPGTRSSVNPGLTKTDVVRMRLAGASPDLRVSGSEQLPGKANYFIGGDSARWHSNVPTFGKVKYTSVYPGVDLVYYGNQQQLEYDFVVAPHADARQIRLRFDKAQKLSLDSSGDLDVIAKDGKIAFHRPVIYQVENGERRLVEGAFALLARNTIGFRLGNYDHSRAVIIDPTLSYSTFLGGYYGASGVGIAADSAGNAYAVGRASNLDFPLTSDAFETTPGNFVTKLNPTGTALVYSTYFDANITAIAIDSTGNAYLTGGSGTIAATAGAYQTANDGITAFVAKLNPTGSALVYLTYLGGSSGTGTTSEGEAIAVDSTGDAYVAGDALTANFPVTPGAFQPTNNAANGPYSVLGGNAFITKLNSTGTALEYSTFLGGADTHASGIAVDESGNAYVTGYTISYDNPAAGFDAVFPTTADSFDPGETLGSTGVETGSTVVEVFGSFITKLNPSGTGLVYSTFLGDGYLEASGSGGDDTLGGPGSTTAIAVDSNGNAYVTGSTSSTDFPVTAGAFQTANKATVSEAANAFVSVLNPSGSALVYSTYLGGSTGASGSQDGANAIAADSAGDAYVAGQAGSTNFPVTSDAYQSVNNGAAAGSSNAFFTELSPSGSSLIYSTYLGGNGDLYSEEGVNDTATAVALDGNGGAYLTGQTGSTNFPITAGAFQTGISGGAAGTAFIAKFAVGSGSGPTGAKIATTTSLTSSANPQTAGSNVTFKATVTPASGNGVPTGTITFSVDGGAGIAVTLNSSGQASYSTSALTAGTHTITATYSGDSNYATSSASLSETITSAPATAASIAVVSGSGQTTPYGSAFASPLVVIVKDASGNPVSGAVVTFSGSGLSFSSATATTGSNGEASVTATAIASGSLTASASTSGVSGTANFSLTATQVALTVTATNASVAYNQPIPALTYTITGFVHGDTSSVLSGAPAETTTATQSSPAGTYPITITQGTLAAANYTFVFVNGTLTISGGVAQTITFAALPNVTYGVSPIKLTATASSGLPVSYTVAGPATVSGSTLTVTGAGSVTVTASQAGNGNYAAATPVSQSFTVSKAPSTTALAAATTTPAQGQADQLTATVTGAGQPAGNVLFTTDPTTLCTSTLSASGVATCSYSPSSTGSITVTAQYQGDANHLGSTASLTLTVGSVSDAAVVLKVTHTELVYPERLEGEVCVTSTTRRPATGTVEILDGSTVLATRELRRDGCAHWDDRSDLNVGTYQLTAAYSGDGNNPAGVSAPVTVTVAPGPVTLELGCRSTSLASGQTLHCEARATDRRTPVSGTLGYSVNGSDGEVALNHGRAAIDVPDPPVGSDTLTITYAAQGNYQAAQPVSVNFTVTATKP